MLSGSPVTVLKAKYWQFAAHRAKQRKRREALARLRQSAHPMARPLAGAIEKTLASDFTSAEYQLLQSIQRLRDELSLSSARVEHRDFGAGVPGDLISEADAQQGVMRSFVVSELAEHTSKDSPWSDLIFSLVRTLRPQACLELGTCIGFSAAYQAGAMVLNGQGRIVTLEGGENFAKFADEHLRSLGLDNYKIVVGRFEDTLGGVLQDDGPFDFMFNDGHHDGEAMLAYFERVLPYFREDGVMLIDDILAYESMQAGWKRLVADERVSLSIDFGHMGLICLGPSVGEAEAFAVPLR